MRLLKTGPYIPGNERLELIEKWGNDIPPYAILSHTWSSDSEEEVLFSDIANGTWTNKLACTKLVKAMEVAKRDGYGWLWIDTCCIDKTSSAELSEAINSMYTYYKNSQKCYAYLSDVVDVGEGMDSFKMSRWWRRGWTLQEMLAPQVVEFYAGEWARLGSKKDLHDVITEITRIETDYLTGNSPIEHASVAKRMSWAASRETTRDEDIAYSLLGIFGVNMPMLYGEGGKRAFLRLQDEILKTSEDQTIFAWIRPQDKDEKDYIQHGMLADSPEDFKSSGNIIPYTEAGSYSPSTMTARGLHINLPLVRKENGVTIAALRCPVPGRMYADWLAVYLRQLPFGTNEYARVDCGKLASVSVIGSLQELYVRQQFSGLAIKTVYPYHFFQLRDLKCTTDDLQMEYRITSCARPTQTVPAPTPEGLKFWGKGIPSMYQIEKMAGALAVALLIERVVDGEKFIVMLGALSDLEVGHCVCEERELLNLSIMRPYFIPQPFPGYVDLKYHRVRLAATERARNDQKIIFIDIEIEGFLKVPTASEMLKGAVDMVKDPDKGVAKTTFRKQVRRLFTDDRVT